MLSGSFAFTIYNFLRIMYAITFIKSIQFKKEKDELENKLNDALEERKADNNQPKLFQACECGNRAHLSKHLKISHCKLGTQTLWF